jgi:hypothetical protein
MSRKPAETSALPAQQSPRVALLVAAAPGHCGGVDVDRAVLELYGLAPEEFTAARNALVNQPLPPRSRPANLRQTTRCSGDAARSWKT